MLPLASLITPNLPEAATLLGEDVVDDVAGIRAQARRLLDGGAQRVLLKGGHLRGPAVDVLAGPEGVHELTSPRLDVTCTHGTGCSLSSAVTALQLEHVDWVRAAQEAKEWLTGAIAAGETLGVGSGHGPVHHFHRLWAAPGAAAAQSASLSTRPTRD